MRKIIKIIGICCVAIIIVVCMYMTMPRKTLDFRGTVTDIEIVSKGTLFYISTTETSYTVLANKKTKISYCCKDDPKIYLADIKVGDTIEGDYRLLSNGTIAKFIKVQYHN